MRLFKVCLYFNGNWVQFGEITTDHPQVQANAIQRALTGRLDDPVVQIRLEQADNARKIYFGQGNPHSEPGPTHDRSDP